MQRNFKLLVFGNCIMGVRGDSGSVQDATMQGLGLTQM